MRQRTLRHRAAGWVDPADAFAALCAGQDRAFWLDSGVHAETGMSYLGVGSATMTSVVSECTVSIDGEAGGHPAGTFAGTTVFDELRFRSQPPDPGGRSSDRGVPLGWIGWLGYELRHQSFPAPVLRVQRPARGVDAALIYVDRLIAFDHSARTVELIAVGERWDGELERWRAATAAVLDRGTLDGGPTTGASALLQRALPDAARALAAVGRARPARWRDTPAQYLAKIETCLAAIREGEVYQLCLTNEVTIEVFPDPLETWLSLRAASPSHHGGYLCIGDTTLLSSSPETFLSVGTDRIARSRPIKGTRPRGATPAEDDQLREELSSNEKERAENLMIVDLMRNDLGRVCDFDTVRVPELFVVESYAQVHQLVSTIEGRLASDRDPIDAVRACFPAGSMTGAPKSRATRILDDLEGRDRGAYSGAFGWFGVDGSIELAMTIRSILLTPAGATVAAGGGITSASIPAEELIEVGLKAAALLAILGVAPDGATLPGR